MSVKELEGIEKFFVTSWTGWDQPDTLSLQLYGVTPSQLTIDKLGAEVAAKVDSVYLDGDHSGITFYDFDGGVIGEFKLQLGFAE